LSCEEQARWKAVKRVIEEARRRKGGMVDEKCE